MSWSPFVLSKLKMWLIHHMHVQLEKIWAWMHEFVMLMLSLTYFGTCMWINQEIELHNVIILHWCHVSMCIFEIWAITCMFCWLKFELELKNSIWKTQIFDVRSSGGIDARAIKSCPQHFLQSWCPLERDISRSSWELLWTSLLLELPIHARAHFSCNQYFCRP